MANQKAEIGAIKQIMKDITDLRDRFQWEFLKDYCTAAITELKELADTLVEIEE